VLSSDTTTDSAPLQPSPPLPACPSTLANHLQEVENLQDQEKQPPVEISELSSLEDSNDLPPQWRKRTRQLTTCVLSQRAERSGYRWAGPST